MIFTDTNSTLAWKKLFPSWSKPKAVPIPISQQVIEIIIADFVLERYPSSARYATPGSNIEIEELRAATDNNIKKIGPIIFPKSIVLNAVWSEIKTSPGPPLASRPCIANIIGKTANPAIMATSVSRAPTLTEVEAIFWSLDIYAP